MGTAGPTNTLAKPPVCAVPRSRHDLSKLLTPNEALRSGSQPLWQIVLRACHGARAASYARFLDRPHPCGGCGCSQVHSSTRQALARGVYTRLHLLLIVGRATRRRSARLSAAAALSQAHGSYCHHPHGVRTRASTTRGIGKRARDDLPTARTAAAFASDSAHVCRVGSAKRFRVDLGESSRALLPMLLGGCARAHGVW